MDFDKPKVYGDTFISDGLVVVVVVVVISMKPVAGGIVGWGRVGKTITEPPIEMSAQALMMATMMLLSLCLN